MNNLPGGMQAPLVEPERPSLYLNADTDSTAEIFSMLDALEAPKRSTRALRLVTGVLLVLAVISIGAVVGSRYGYGVMFKEWLGDQFKRPVSIQPKEGEPSMAPQAVAPKLRPPPVAVILDESAGQESPLEKTVVASRSGSIVEASRATAPVVHPRQSTEAAPTEHGNSFGRKKTRQKEKEHKPSRSNSSGATNGKQVAKDRDVDLIAALLLHAPRPTDGKSPVERKSVSPTKNFGPAQSPKYGKEPARDIVLNSTGESTEALVQRCQRLGFLEGQLCRLRICSGLWGSDPACPLAVEHSPN